MDGYCACIDRRVHLRFFFHDIIAVTLSWSEAFDLTGVGPYFGHPLSCGDGPYSPTLSTPPGRAAERTLWLSHRLYLSLNTRWMWTDNMTLFGQKTSSCLHNPKHLRRNSLCRYCTFHRKPDFPLHYRVSSPPASQDIYCYCHNDLIEAKEPFVGLELFALQIRAPCARMTALYQRFSRPTSTQ